MPNAAEELMGSCDTASHGAIAIWNRLEGRAALRGADPSDKTCNAACNAACEEQMPKRPRTNAERCRGTAGQLRRRSARAAQHSFHRAAYSHHTGFVGICVAVWLWQLLAWR